MEPAKGQFGSKIEFSRNNYDALQDAHALVLITEWNEYRYPDFQRMKEMMKTPVIFDGRNIYNPEEMRKMGYVYFGIGRKGEKTTG